MLLSFLTLLFSFVPSAQAYTDTEGYEFLEAAEYLTEQGVVGGYADGTLKPDNAINRAEFLKIVVEATAGTPEGEQCFTDVNSQWFASYICFAKEAGIVSGYPDGSYVPAKTIQLIEALKILAEAFDLELDAAEGDQWYSAYLETLAGDGVVPYTLEFYSEPITRGEAFEMLWRIMEEKREEEATSLEEFVGPLCVEFEPESYANIDMDRVRETWLAWTNEARAAQGLYAYVYNEQLDRTAYEWSVTGRARGSMSHKRTGTAYYDYYEIQDWFSDFGLTFSNVGGYTFTENIGRGPYSCSAADCTDELIEAIEYTFDYFMSEATSSYRPHYNSIMNSTFKDIGFGLVVDSGSYYFTVHYATEISSSPAPFCD